jgi:hypothetical protein
MLFINFGICPLSAFLCSILKAGSEDVKQREMAFATLDEYPKI